MGVPEEVSGTEEAPMVHGRTEGGAVACVTVQGPDAAAVAAGVAAGVRPEWWPAFGLEPVPGTPEPDLSVTVDPASPSSVDRAESDLGLFTVEHLARWVAVHAALVRVDGVVLALPGASHAGKSTLCGAVLEAGGEVLSDEYALLSPDASRVAGWPRRVRLREATGGFRRTGMAAGGEVERVDLVALISFDPVCAEPLEVAALPPAELVTGVLANTVCAASRPRIAFEAVVAWCRSVPGVAGVRGEASAALEALVRLARAGVVEDAEG